MGVFFVLLLGLATLFIFGPIGLFVLLALVALVKLVAK